LVDSLDELVALKDVSGRILLVNQAYADHMGLPKDAIEGANREEFFPDPELAELAKWRHDQVVSTGRVPSSKRKPKSVVTVEYLSAGKHPSWIPKGACTVSSPPQPTSPSADVPKVPSG
jgi:hypothetical protein